jgi:hypothetical protein
MGWLEIGEIAKSEIGREAPCAGEGIVKTMAGSAL